MIAKIEGQNHFAADRADKRGWGIFHHGGTETRRKT